MQCSKNLTDGGHEGAVQSESEDRLTEMGQEILHHSTYHIHITHLHRGHFTPFTVLPTDHYIYIFETTTCA